MKNTDQLNHNGTPSRRSAKKANGSTASWQRALEKYEKRQLARKLKDQASLDSSPKSKANRPQSHVKFSNIPQLSNHSSNSSSRNSSERFRQKSAQSEKEIERLVQMSREAQASNKRPTKGSLKSGLFKLKSARLHRRCRAGYSEMVSRQDMGEVMEQIKRENRKNEERVQRAERRILGKQKLRDFESRVSNNSQSVRDFLRKLKRKNNIQSSDQRSNSVGKDFERITNHRKSGSRPISLGGNSSDNYFKITPIIVDEGAITFQEYRQREKQHNKSHVMKHSKSTFHMLTRNQLIDDCLKDLDKKPKAMTKQTKALIRNASATPAGLTQQKGKFYHHVAKTQKNHTHTLTELPQYAVILGQKQVIRGLKSSKNYFKVQKDRECMTRFTIKDKILRKGYHSSTSPRRAETSQSMVIKSARTQNRHRILVNAKPSVLSSLYKVEGAQVPPLKRSNSFEQSKYIVTEQQEQRQEGEDSKLLGQVYFNKTERQSVVDGSNKQTTLDECQEPKLHRPSQKLFKRLKIYTAKPMIKNPTRTEALNSASHVTMLNIQGI